MKTIVVGAALVDVIMNIDRLPKSGDDIYCKDVKNVVGGCAFNVAKTLKNLECEHDLFVPVGTGIYADIISEKLIEEEYPILIKDTTMDNGHCLSFVESDGERTFITIQGIEDEYRKEWLDKLKMDEYQNIYVPGYRVNGNGGMIIADWLLGQQDKSIYFAPGPVFTSIQTEVLEKIFSMNPILHLNQREAIEYVKEDRIEECLRKLYSLTNNIVIVTLGAKGTIYFDGNNMKTIPSVKVQATDTIGAGDSHVATVIAGISRGMDLEESIHLANKVASLIVQVQGSVIEKEEFIEKMGE